MSKVYGYARISTAKQSIERQVRNIKDFNNEAIVIKEVFTGTKVQGRKELDKLLKIVKKGDMIIFDSVSRMSRNAEEGFKLYEKLFNEGVNLVFLKERHIDTDTYRKALTSQIEMTGEAVDVIFEGINKYLMILAKEQIKIAFGQAEKEVQDLRQRTKEGLVTAKMNGKQVGQVKGTKLVTKKSVEAKAKIKKYNKDFGGSLNNEETWKLIGITKTTFYKYKKELLEEK